MDISEKKNQINDLLQDIFSEYNRMNETKIQSNCEKDLEMRTMISTIKSLENSEKEKENNIRSLKKQLNEYENMINDLQSKLEIADQEEQENNKFDMLRIQAKEITMKDREIDRLNKLLNTYRDNNKIDKVISKIENKVNIENVIVKEVEINETIEVIETVKEDNDSNVVENVEESDKEDTNTDVVVEDTDVVENVDESDKEDTNTDVVEKIEESDKEDTNTDVVVDKGSLLLINYRKKPYYIYENESPQHVYTHLNDEVKETSVGDIVGIREKNEKGKFKIKIFTPLKI